MTQTGCPKLNWFTIPNILERHYKINRISSGSVNKDATDDDDGDTTLIMA